MIMQDHGMLENILQHSIMVCNVALSIGKSINKNGGTLNLSLIEGAALLHDITKTRSLTTGENHAESGKQLLQELGFHQIAHIVGEHIIPGIYDGNLSEAEIVSYADKRVLHDQLVSLEERFRYLFKRYGRTDAAIGRIGAMEKHMHKIEEKINTCTTGLNWSLKNPLLTNA
ncbi:MAG: HD domain-containing protein [Deltaproteobacteria bacterium]|nr:HD domain-containing protein [Deltaproteobacteria bacterium]